MVEGRGNENAEHIDTNTQDDQELSLAQCRDPCVNHRQDHLPFEHSTLVHFGLTALATELPSISVRGKCHLKPPGQISMRYRSLSWSSNIGESALKFQKFEILGGGAEVFCKWNQTENDPTRPLPPPRVESSDPISLKLPLLRKPP
ncbi:hypothetical protein CAPTEDRAFT_200733 [Capitella teleta]|uniref:Uncharacterized protein n=1 Tax=Capitella teleta TaxID=283909 RepID=R7USS4_CAPTE|nr:hypothetical protein CAPTEDRAFT_200733 [Capitella teleta]|eukprot:ELU09255.1 hypothetical protein CAPTEDRAFT_200733 [Capitella teleta]